MLHRSRILSIFLSALLLSLAISLRLEVSPASVKAQSQALLVGAAASLQDVFEEINSRFEAINPSARIRYNFAASGALQRQIEQGAPIDLFISAAVRPMNSLEERGLLLQGTRRNLLSNRLALIVPKNAAVKIDGFMQLADPRIKRIAIGEPRSVPAGQYAEEVLGNLGILEKIRPKLVFSNSVRGVLASVANGNADAGIVYTTDAKISKQVIQVAIASERLHTPIVYPIAVIASSKNKEGALTYANFLSGNEAKRIFQRYGFSFPK